MATEQFNPDAHPESTSVDGFVNRTGVNETFATIRAGAGNGSGDTNASVEWCRLAATTTTNQYSIMRRMILLFDTSSIPAGATITSATLNFYANSKSDGLTQSLVLVSSNPTSNTALANEDYANVGTTALSNTLAISAVTTSSYNTLTLNAAGLAAITQGGITKLGVTMESDRANSAPSWSSGAASFVQADLAEGTNPPVLEVTYSDPTTTSTTTSSSTSTTTTSTSTTQSTSTTTSTSTSTTITSTSTSTTATSTSSTTSSSTTTSLAQPVNTFIEVEESHRVMATEFD